VKFDIDLYKTKNELIRQTADQIIRDFERFGLEITFSGNIDFAYEELFSQLNSSINYLIDVDYGKLMALLYQIDISEYKIAEKEAEFPAYNKSEILSELIIHRELQKVITRNYYKHNKSL